MAIELGFSPPADSLPLGEGECLLQGSGAARTMAPTSIAHAAIWGPTSAPYTAAFRSTTRSFRTVASSIEITLSGKIADKSGV